MYERRFESRQMRQMRQEVVHIRPAAAKERGVYMSTMCSGGAKKKQIDRFADGALSLFFGEKAQAKGNEFCFWAILTIALFFGGQVIRGLIG